MSKSSIYILETTDGQRLVRADTLALARKHVIEHYFNGEQRKASAEDVARVAKDAGGLVIEDAGELGAISPRGVGEGDVGVA